MVLERVVENGKWCEKGSVEEKGNCVFWHKEKVVKLQTGCTLLLCFPASATRTGSEILSLWRPEKMYMAGSCKYLFEVALAWLSWAGRSGASFLAGQEQLLAGILLVDECRRGRGDPAEANPVVTIGKFQEGKLGEDPSSSLKGCELEFLQREAAWTLRSAGAGGEGFNCKAVREHHVFSVLSCGFFSPYFTQGGTFLIFSLVPEFSRRQPAHPLCYSWLHELHMPMGKFSSVRHFCIGFAVPACVNLNVVIVCIKAGTACDITTDHFRGSSSSIWVKCVQADGEASRRNSAGSAWISSQLCLVVVQLEFSKSARVQHSSLGRAQSLQETLRDSVCATPQINQILTSSVELKRCSFSWREGLEEWCVSLQPKHSQDWMEYYCHMSAPLSRTAQLHLCWLSQLFELFCVFGKLCCSHSSWRGLRLLYLTDVGSACEMFLNYILCSVRNKDQIPFHAVVLARGMLQPGGNIVPMFVYATEINGGKGAKVCSAGSHMLLKVSVKKFLNQVPGSCRHERHECHWGPLSPMSSLPVPTFSPQILAQIEKKQPVLSRSVSAKIQGGCRSMRRSLLDPDPSTLCSSCKHRIHAKNMEEKETNRGQTIIRMGKASWPAVFRIRLDSVHCAAVSSLLCWFVTIFRAFLLLKFERGKCTNSSEVHSWEKAVISHIFKYPLGLDLKYIAVKHEKFRSHSLAERMLPGSCLSSGSP
ncbi:hypothetical protein EK904_000134, partial [Melospiza melodia maxima]